MSETVFQIFVVAFVWFCIIMPMINKVTEPSEYDDYEYEEEISEEWRRQIP